MLLKRLSGDYCKSISCILIICKGYRPSPADYLHELDSVSGFVAVWCKSELSCLSIDESGSHEVAFTNFHHQHVRARETHMQLFHLGSGAVLPQTYRPVSLVIEAKIGIIGDRPHVLVNRLTWQTYTNFIENTFMLGRHSTDKPSTRSLIAWWGSVHFSRTVRRYWEWRVS